MLFISFMFPVSNLNNLNDLHCCFNKLFGAPVLAIQQTHTRAICHAAAAAVCVFVYLQRTHEHLGLADQNTSNRQNENGNGKQP